MSEVTGEELFKTTLMGGFDKEDVLNQFNDMKNNADLRESDLLETIKKKDEEIASLKAQAADAVAQMEQLKKEVDEKYKGYVDNVDMIGRIICDSQIKSEQTIKAANETKDAIIAKANEDAAAKLNAADTEAAQRIEAADNKAKAMINAAQESVNEKINEGASKYIAIQEEVGELLQFVNKVQHRFMQTVKVIQELSEGMNISKSSEGDLDA